MKALQKKYLLPKKQRILNFVSVQHILVDDAEFWNGGILSVVKFGILPLLSERMKLHLKNLSLNTGYTSWNIYPANCYAFFVYFYEFLVRNHPWECDV